MTIDIDLKDNNLDSRIKTVKKDKTLKSLRRNKRKEKNLPILSEKDKKKKKKKTIIILTILSILLLGLGFLVYRGYLFSHEFGFRLTPGSLLSLEKKTLKKDPSGNFTNILLVGLDTRENSGLLNTDTIMIASYNHTTHNITLLSIPRDFHVEVREGVSWYGRINSVYSAAENREKDSGINQLQKTVERIIGKEIQYYALVDFMAFVDIIDTIGGIDINVENSFTDHRYPLGTGYQTVSFKAGPQTMDGKTALIYSRSRHSLQNNEGSDFARARRQQNVIIALRDKLLSSQSFTNPRTLIGVASSLTGNLRISEFTTKDIEGAIKLAQKYDEKGGKVFSFVLDPTIGNYSLVENVHLESGAYAIGPKLGLGKYDDIQDFVKIIMHSPEIYDENARIMVYDTGTGNQTARTMTDLLKEQFPYTNITFAGTLYSDKEEVVIYSQEENEYRYTVSILGKFLKAQSKKQPEYITSNLNGANVTILLGSNLELKEE